jgi:hypothetical protein
MDEGYIVYDHLTSNQNNHPLVYLTYQTDFVLLKSSYHLANLE